LGDLPYAPDQIMHLQGNINRLEHATGWEPIIALEEGLRRTVAWHIARRNPIH
jgi:UDP-glucose 4-epimerase